MSTTTTRTLPLLRVLPLLLVIAVVSMGVHDVAIEHLGIPYPTPASPPAWLPVVKLAVRLGSAVIFCRLSGLLLTRYQPIPSSLIVGLLLACLAESFRLAIVLFSLTHGWVDSRWVFTAVKLVSDLAVFGIQGCVVVMIARCVPGKSIAMIAAIVVAALVLGLAVSPAIRELANAASARLGASEPRELYQPPYDASMLSIIYATFLEPTVAALFVARLTWARLPAPGVVKIGAFTLLILGMTGRLTLLALDSFWVSSPMPLSFLSTGQFFAETLVMAALVGLLQWRLCAKAGEPPMHR